MPGRTKREAWLSFTSMPGAGHYNDYAEMQAGCQQSFRAV